MHNKTVPLWYAPEREFLCYLFMMTAIVKKQRRTIFFDCMCGYMGSSRKSLLPIRIECGMLSASKGTLSARSALLNPRGVGGAACFLFAPSGKEGLPYDYNGSFNAFTCNYWHLQPVYSGRKEVTAGLLARAAITSNLSKG